MSCIGKAELSPDAFQNAVHKGLGRAMVAVRESKPGRYDDLIVESCLHDQQDCRYVDALRFPYQMRLLELAGLEAKMREILLREIRTSTHTGDIDWMLAMLGGYAQKGDEDATQVLKEHSQRGNDWAQQTLAHCGDEPLEWLIERVLPKLLETNGGTQYQWHRREEFPEETPVRRRLRAILRQDEKRSRIVRSPTPQRRTPGRFLRLLRGSRLPPHAWSDFRKASEEDYRELIERWLADPSGPLQRVALATLPCRPLPVPFERLLTITEHPKAPWIIHRLFRSLPHPEARKYAFHLLQERPIPWSALDTLHHSFQKGDEKRLEEALPEIARQDRSSRFSLIISLTDVMERYPEVDWQSIAEWIFEHADDSFLRRESVEWMAEFGTLPKAIREEGVEDAEPVVRRLCANGRTPRKS